MADGTGTPLPRTIPRLRRMKREGQRIAMLTAYDHPTAQLAEQAGVDVLLVGDSLAQVVQGRTTTLPVTLDEMVYHTAIVARAVHVPLVVADMPFGSYHGSIDRVLDHVTRLVQVGGAQAVKMEGIDAVDAIRWSVRAGVPVMGHLGLQPQAIAHTGAYSVQARSEQQARQLREEALRLQEAGVCALVLELVVAEVAQRITEELDIPTIGIGSGAGCDGQVLVFHDVVGYEVAPKPKTFVKRYAAVGGVMQEALRQYVVDVKSGAFPERAHSFGQQRPISSEGTST